MSTSPSHYPSIAVLKPLFALILVTLFVLVTPPRAAADTVIDTTGSWNGIQSLCCFGWPDAESIGETIVVPAGAPVLESFTFYLEVPTAATFQGEVYAWNGTAATGPNLFQSALMSSANSASFVPFTFSTGGVLLTPGSAYILFVTTSNGNQAAGLGEFGFTSSDAYPDGAEEFINNGTNTSLWTSATWSFPSDGDLAFKADFASAASTPEPSVLMLVAAGLLPIAVSATARRGRNPASRHVNLNTRA